MEYNFADVIKEKVKMCDKYCLAGYCNRCPLASLNNGHKIICDKFMERYPEEYAKIVIDWAEAHKPKTNGEVAKELLEEKFGIEMPKSFTGCTFTKCTDIDDCANCPNHHFWDKEYAGE